MTKPVDEGLPQPQIPRGTSGTLGTVGSQERAEGIPGAALDLEWQNS